MACVAAVTLHRRQIEPVAKLQNMRRSGIAIEFGRHGQAHAATFAQVGDLLFGQRLNRTVLQAGIRLNGLRQDTGRNRHRGDQNQILHGILLFAWRAAAFGEQFHHCCGGFLD